MNMIWSVSGDMMLGKDVVTPEAEEDAFHVILFERREVPYDQKYM